MALGRSKISIRETALAVHGSSLPRPFTTRHKFGAHGKIQNHSSTDIRSQRLAATGDLTFWSHTTLTQSTIGMGIDGEVPNKNT